jgi:hypothetical protein
MVLRGNLVEEISWSSGIAKADTTGSAKSSVEAKAHCELEQRILNREPWTLSRFGAGRLARCERLAELSVRAESLMASTVVKAYRQPH